MFKKIFIFIIFLISIETIEAKELHFRSNIMDAFTYQSGTYENNFAMFINTVEDNNAFSTHPTNSPGYYAIYENSHELPNWSEKTIHQFAIYYDVAVNAKDFTDQVYFTMIAQQRIWNELYKEEKTIYGKNGDLVTKYETKFNQELEKYQTPTFLTKEYNIEKELIIEEKFNWEQYEISSDSCQITKTNMGIKITACKKENNQITFKNKEQNELLLFKTLEDKCDMFQFKKYQTPNYTLKITKKIEETIEVPKETPLENTHQITDVPKTYETSPNINKIFFISLCFFFIKKKW